MPDFQVEPPGQPDQRPHVAIAILYQRLENQPPLFLMQLRDDIPGIAYPGHWGFFGGHLEPGESADIAVQRELQEEIGYSPPTLSNVGTYESDKSIRHVYHGPLIVPLESLQLNEGWDMALFTIDEIRQGERFSQRANGVKPIGEPHQNILLEFIAQSDPDWTDSNRRCSPHA